MLSLSGCEEDALGKHRAWDICSVLSGFELLQRTSGYSVFPFRFHDTWPRSLISRHFCGRWIPLEPINPCILDTQDSA